MGKRSGGGARGGTRGRRESGAGGVISLAAAAEDAKSDIYRELRADSYVSGSTMTISHSVTGTQMGEIDLVTGRTIAAQSRFQATIDKAAGIIKQRASIMGMKTQLDTMNYARDNEARKVKQRQIKAAERRIRQY